MRAITIVFALATTVFMFAHDKPSDGKPRVYVSDSQSWQMAGGFASHGDSTGNFAAGELLFWRATPTNCAKHSANVPSGGS
jgi:hypothetical protein